MPDQTEPQGLRTVIWAVVPCALLTILLGLLSDGVHHDDDLTHFLMARWVRWFPTYLIHIWGRPGLTIPLSAVSWFGDADTAWHAARVLSALVTAATALIAARLAARLGLRNAWLVVVACYLQPLNTLLSLTTLTENFCALYLIAAVALLHAGLPVRASAVFALALVTRHEAVILLPLWWAALVTARGGRRNWVFPATIALWAPMLHNAVFWLVFGRWPAGILFAPTGSTEHPALGLFGYVPQALLAIPPVVAGLALVGGIRFLRRDRWLIPLLAGLFFLTHAAITGFGLFASGGYGRFMVTVAPFVAILAVAGLEKIVQCVRERTPGGAHWLLPASIWPIGLLAFEVERRAGRIPIHDTRSIWALYAVSLAVIFTVFLSWRGSGRRWGPSVRRATVVLLVLTCVAQWASIVQPLRFRDDPHRVREVVKWLEDASLQDAPLFTTNPWFSYFLNLVEHPRAHKNGRLLATMPVGTIFVWDSRYSASDYHRLRLEAFQNDACYQHLKTFHAHRPGLIEMHVFRKVAETPVPTASEPTYPANLMSGGEPFSGIFYLRPDDR